MLQPTVNTIIADKLAAKDKKKSMRISTAIHVALLALLAFPFATQIQKATQEYTEVVMVDFRDFTAASAKSSATAGAEAAEVTTTETKVETPAKPKPVEAKPEAPKPPVKAAPVAVKDNPIKTEKKPVKTTSPKVEKPVAKPTPKPTSSKGAAKTAGNKGSGTVGKKGKSDVNLGTTDGKADKGDAGMDFSGDGLFTRRVIKRAEIKHLSKKEGIMVVNLCVNRDGGVVYAQFNKKDSNIKDGNLVAEAIRATRKYRFEPDYTAPEKQCGKLTYIIKLD